MDEIVTKVADAAPRKPGTGGGMGLDLTVRVQAHTVHGHRKVAEAWANVGGADLSRWQIVCDEGANLGGDDSAPPPLVYFGAAAAFCLLTQISRSGDMLKLALEDVRIDQTLELYRTGSVRAGTIKSGCREMTLQINVVSPDPPEKIAELIRVAQESCFVHGSLTEVVPVTTTLNGEPLADS
jgi:uncharacterized OsmC-like protein